MRTPCRGHVVMQIRQNFILDLHSRGSSGLAGVAQLPLSFIIIPFSRFGRVASRRRLFP
jgi:hypothetical protein